MKISKNTISTLKNLSTINTNLIIKKGNMLSTISAQKNVVADVAVDDEFPCEFGIYDLPEFIGALSLFEDPDVEFTEKTATISSGRSKIRYFAADTALLVAPTKKINFPTADVEFEIDQTTLGMAIKTAGVLRSADITIEGDGNEITLVVADLKNANSNSFRVTLGETDKTFTANLKVENLKMPAGDYEVSLSSKKISRFKNKVGDATYYLALESTSSFS